MQSLRTICLKCFDLNTICNPLPKSRNDWLANIFFRLNQQRTCCYPTVVMLVKNNCSLPNPALPQQVRPCKYWKSRFALFLWHLKSQSPLFWMQMRIFHLIGKIPLLLPRPPCIYRSHHVPLKLTKTRLLIFPRPRMLFPTITLPVGELQLDSTTFCFCWFTSLTCSVLVSSSGVAFIPKV